jgi:amino acid adenylation domain-containing protein/non-ribosomal peptide synthase protein (TIGR01720 family)
MAEQTIPPPVANATALKSISTEEKRKLLAQLLARKAAQPQVHPASFGQARLWFMEQLAGETGKATYNIVIALGLEGSLNQTVLLASLNEIIRRHAVLRTTFQSDPAGNPSAVIAPSLKLALPSIDLTATDEDALQSYLTAQIDRPFDLTAGPLVRAELLRRSANEHILLWVVHHSIFDGFSIAVWNRELSALYTAFLHNRPSPLPELALQYHHFARWQREQMSGEELRQQLEYWKRQLAGAPPLLTLPTDFPRPEVQTTNGSTYRHLFSAELSQALKRLSQSAGVTLFTTLQSVFTILLARYSGQHDIVIGTAVTSRSRPQFEPLIGFLVNTLALRTDLSDNPSFTELLKRVQDTTRAAIINQDIPFERLVSALSPQRNTSHAPIAQVSISWTQSLMDPGAGFGNLIAKPYPVNSTTAQRDLSLLLTEMEGTIASLWEYNTDLFAPSTLERMVANFEVLLQSVVQNPERPVLELPMLTEAEHTRIVRRWNGNGADYGTAVTVPALFQQQVERAPEAIAVVFQQQEFTYAELNARANRLAYRLIELGVQPDGLVAVAMGRSVDMIVSLLAILKAGGAYVPIDPAYPVERIRYMLGDCGAGILLTQSHLGTAGYEAEAQTILTVDTMERDLASQPDSNPAGRASVHHAAYVIYTSGSTGSPKGVVIEHAALFNYLQWCRATYGVDSGNGTIVHSSLAFDLTVTSVWAPLTAGSRIHLLPENDCVDVLVEGLRSTNNLSFLKLTPAHLQLLNQQLTPDEFRGRAHALIIGGEALHKSMLAPWLKFAPETRLINEYGPTEAAVGCVVHTAANADGNEWIRIGRPVANTQIYVLDEYLAPVPAGVSGELYIGGAQLARGYLNRPELTAERFISHGSFGRLYKTGDLCRWLADGTLEYIGRTDFQVKVRGFRIELGEIENALLGHEAVGEAVVVARDNQAGQKQLAAYMVCHPDVDTEVLRSHLSQRLPEYMVPPSFTKLTTMPLTSNGKVNRAALPAPDYREAKTGFVAPQDETQAAFAAVFAEVLNLPEIGIHDNFFHLGGDSILVLKLVSKTAEGGYSVKVKDLFRCPTVAQLAAAVQAPGASAAPKILASQEVQLGDALLLPVQRRFLDANHQDMHHSNQPFLLEVKSPLDPAQLEAAIGSLLRHHDALRFQYDRDGSGGWRQRYREPGGAIPLTVVEFESAAQLEAVGTETQSTSNPLTGDVIRFVYFRNDSADAGRLLFAIHHLVTDGVSRRLLMEDLTTLLDGKRLPPKTSSYRDWGEALHSAANSGHFDADLHAWLADEAEATSLPVDDPGALNALGSSHYISFTLDSAPSEHLLRTLPALQDVNLDAVILTALTETLAGWSGQRSIRIQLESYGRQELFDTIDLNRTVGWFTSIYPLTVQLFEGGPVERMRRTRDRLRRVADGGISFGALRYFHPDPDVRARLQKLAMAPVMYNNFSRLGSMENHRFATAQESPGLRVSPNMRRDTLIDCDVLTIDKRIHVAWRVSPQIHRENAEALLHTLQRRLESFAGEARTQ